MASGVRRQWTPCGLFTLKFSRACIILALQVFLPPWASCQVLAVPFWSLAIMFVLLVPARAPGVLSSLIMGSNSKNMGIWVWPPWNFLTSHPLPSVEFFREWDLPSDMLTAIVWRENGHWGIFAPSLMLLRWFLFSHPLKANLARGGTVEALRDYNQFVILLSPFTCSLSRERYPPPPLLGQKTTSKKWFAPISHVNLSFKKKWNVQHWLSVSPVLV